ncbi:hypothetical protein ARMGADRAFT_1008608 [Armillaria gallica]|uniref:Secreted protein n=1 Tax=Armillaria gallica TaxID=47427 RepID=A0A2H3EFA3_ARMGA|nr:hypothetical protein ARMGADRAFT_1008608 [Armillaria gallica]
MMSSCVCATSLPRILLFSGAMSSSLCTHALIPLSTSHPHMCPVLPACASIPAAHPRRLCQSLYSVPP